MDEFVSVDSDFSVDRLPTGVKCGVKSGEARIDTTITAMATCVDFDEPELMLETVEIVSITETKKRTSHFVRAACPDNKKLVAHRCLNKNDDNSQNGFGDAEIAASCLFETNAVAINLCISNRSSSDCF